MMLLKTTHLLKVFYFARSLNERLIYSEQDVRGCDRKSSSKYAVASTTELVCQKTCCESIMSFITDHLT